MCNSPKAFLFWSFSGHEILSELRPKNYQESYFIRILFRSVLMAKILRMPPETIYHMSTLICRSFLDAPPPRYPCSVYCSIQKQLLTIFYCRGQLLPTTEKNRAARRAHILNRNRLVGTWAETPVSQMQILPEFLQKLLIADVDCELSLH